MTTEAMQVLEETQIGVGARLAARRTTHLCMRCRERRSRFRHRGVVKADADHTLCFRCYRALANSLRARRLAGRLPASEYGERTPMRKVVL